MDGVEEMKISFVIGNGHSRTVFDLKNLKDVGVTYGCNLLIEEFQLDNTVACDRAMLVHLLAQGYDTVTNLWTRSRWRKMIGTGSFHELPDPVIDPKIRWDKEIHWGSGTHAIHLAASQGADVVVMLGFDLWPRTDGLNNLYNDRTEFYDPKKVVDPSHWIHQINMVISKFKNVDFVQIQPRSWKDPDEWIKQENYSRDDYSGLASLISDR